MLDQQYAQILAQGETLTVEFKSAVDDRQLVEAVTCLANGEGGLLFIGVDDSGQVVGATKRHGNITDVDRVQAMIRNQTEPPLTTEVRLFDSPDGDILYVEVPIGTTVVATSKGTYVRRVIGADGKPQCIPMRPHEVLARAGSIGASDYSMVPLPNAIEDQDLDPNEFDRLRALDQIGGDGSLALLSNTEILRALQFLRPDGQLTVGAVLIFGTPSAIDRYAPAYEVGFQEIETLEVRTNKRWRAPLLQAFEELVGWIDRHNPEEEVEVGLLRIGLPRFTNTALRELIANAIVHRDFAQLGPTLIELDESALQISNPGGFPNGVTIDNLLRTPPRARNPGIAAVFKLLGLVESTSRGVNRAFESQLRAGRAAPDYSRTSAASVVVRLRSGPSDKELAAFISERRQSGEHLDVNDLLVLHEVRTQGRITTARAAQLFQVLEGEARGLLNRLVEAGMLEARGERKGRTYHMAAGVYRALGQSAGYVRTRGFDELQQTQMILKFLEHQGRITRSDAAELCQLDPVAAGYLLRKMRDEGVLEMVGQKRGAHYVIAAEPTT